MDLLIFLFGAAVTVVVGGALTAGIVSHNRRFDTVTPRATAGRQRRTG